MNRRLFAFVPFAALFVVSLVNGPHDRPGARVEGPLVAAPAPPNSLPSRKRTAGPTERLAWETRRLADPATGRIPADIHRREMRFAAGLPRWERGAAFASFGAGTASDKIDGWSYRGPWNIGGRTRALAIDVSDPTFATLLAGGVSGGMWRSTDEGASWTLTTGSSQLHAVSAVVQDTRPGQQSVWYYGTGEIRGNSAGGGGAPYRGDGIFKSTDGGLSWNLLPATSGADPTVFSGEWQYVNRLAIDPSATVADEVYAAVYGFIERSTDGGASWTRVLGSATTQARYTDVVVSSTGIVYASLSADGEVSGIFRSTDGILWTDITPAVITGHNRAVLALAPSDESVLYVLTSDRNGTTNEGFYKYQYLSGDGSGAGGTWLDRSMQMDSIPGPDGDEFMECYGSYCQTVTVNPANPDIVYVGGIHLIRSTDGFATNNADAWIGGWQYEDHHADQHSLVFVPGSTSVAFSGSDGGVHKTNDIGAGNVSWIPLSNGYNTSQFYTAAIDENLPGSDVVIGGMQDNGTWFTASTAGTQPWVEVLGGDGSYCAVVDASGTVGTYLVSVQNGVVYRFGVNNTTGAWTGWTRVDPTGGGEYLFINPLTVNPNDTHQLFVASDNGIWRNSDVTVIPLWSDQTTTLNWTRLTTEPVATAISALAVSRSVDPILYYGSADGDMYRLDNADTAPATSTPTVLDMGPDWPAFGYVSDIAVHPDDDQQVLVAVSNYNVSSLFFSADGGTSWASVEGNLGGADGPSVRAVAIVPFSGRDIYVAGTSTGLYTSVALAGTGTIWSLEAAELIGNVVVDQLATRPADGLIVAGTHGKGVFSVNIPIESAVTDDLPRGGLALQQNVPNPFNPLTRISFVLPEAGQTRLVVYDVAGRLVRTLVDGDLAAGDHTISWNGADDAGRQVSAGIYLYQLQNGAVDEVRRMTLVR